MKALLRRLSWAAVVAAVLAVAALVLGTVEQPSLALASGLAGITFAVLATREG